MQLRIMQTIARTGKVKRLAHGHVFRSLKGLANLSWGGHEELGRRLILIAAAPWFSWSAAVRSWRDVLDAVGGKRF